MVEVLVRIPVLLFAHGFMVAAYVIVEAVLMKAAVGHGGRTGSVKRGVTRIRHIPWWSLSSLSCSQA
jgi:hypothetical protein